VQRAPHVKDDHQSVKMRVVITGATGFIGRALSQRLHRDYEIVALSRNMQKAAASLNGIARPVAWDGMTTGARQSELEGAAAVVNLAGENVASGRWTKSRKARILRSRIDCTRVLVQAISNAKTRPAAMIQASAIGYYGPRGDERLDENSSPGSGFLAEVCQQAEEAGRRVETLGVRYVAVRTGVVLGHGGALAKMIRPFRFYLGGHLGSGKQWLSWMSLEDEIAAIERLIKDTNLSGAFNLTSPRPVTMREFSRTLGRTLNRPAWLPVPAFALRILVGEMAEEMLLSGQRVVPKRLAEAGFEFKHEYLEQALTALLR
jgi:uncharacterized protein (TIGR01777 family)